MLTPAILYRDEIIAQLQARYYSKQMFYMCGDIANWLPDIYDNPNWDCVQMAIVDNAGKLIGYMQYRVAYYTSYAYNFNLFSFDDGNPLIGKEAFNILESLIEQFHRVEWRAVSCNPACRGYDHFIERHNGTKHVLKDASRDETGNYYDDFIYEIVGDVK